MPLLRNNTLIADTWTRVGTEEPLPETGDVVVPFSRLLREWDSLRQRQGRLGVEFANIDRAEALAMFLPRLALVVLTFPAFADGRSYSLARQIREFGYRGELCAAGNILPDQLQFMLQVGFDAFEIGERFPLAVWQRASRQMSLAYQRGLFRRSAEAEVWSERHNDAEPWLEQPHAG